MIVNIKVVQFQGSISEFAWFDMKNSVKTLMNVPMTVCGLLNFQMMCKFFKMNFKYLTNMGDFCCSLFMQYPFHIIALLLVSVFTIAMSLIWVKFFPAQKFFSRKVLHVVSIFILSVSIEQLNLLYLNQFIALLCGIELILLFAVNYGFFYSEGRKSWGIVYFLPPTILLLFLFPSQILLISLSLKILAFSDGFSAIIGRIFENALKPHLIGEGDKSVWRKFDQFNRISWGSDLKTFIGSYVFFVSTMIILGDAQIPFQWIVFIGFVLTFTELLSGKGSDNFFIPILSFVLIQFSKSHLSIESNYWLMGVGVFFVLYVINLKFKWLSQSGFVFAAILGSIVLMNGMSLWPLIVFFLMGTLSGKLNKSDISDAKHSKPRDAFQVLANGGGVLVLILIQTLLCPSENLDTFMLVSVAVACSDTLSSEIGMRFGKKAYNIFTWREVPKGLSGGVSISGFFGAFIGAFAIALFDENEFGFILFWGIMGSILDSVFGMLFQAKYLNAGVLSDRKEGNLVKGYAFVTNDFINFLSNILVLILSLLLPIIWELLS